jgi:hypothetical protein
MKARQLELPLVGERRRRKGSPGFEALRRLRRQFAAQIEEERRGRDPYGGMGGGMGG